jgi:hypothetical protein
MSEAGSPKSKRRGVIPTTVGESLYWSYANLVMAHKSKSHTRDTYQQLDYIVRNKAYYGFLKGTMRVGSFLADEQSKIAAQVCSYCGSDTFLSLDHLVPQFSGGAHSADNLVVACRSCNSSKGKQDFLDWMGRRKQFPPMKPLRRYLKLAVRYCTEHDLMDVRLEHLDTIVPPVPFSLALLPYEYPQPSEFSWHRADRDADESPS